MTRQQYNRRRVAAAKALRRAPPLPAVGELAQAAKCMRNALAVIPADAIPPAAEDALFAALVQVERLRDRLAGGG